MSKKQNRTNKIHSKICFRVIPLIFLAGFWIQTEAQDTGNSTRENQSAHLKNREKDSSKHSGGLEQEITVTMPIPQIQFSSCEAYISIQSHQRDKLARVESTIEQKTCEASKGQYELLIFVKDGNGDSQTLKFSETWEQNDSSPVESSRDYPIGENVTLKRVMAQGIRCECSDS